MDKLVEVFWLKDSIIVLVGVGVTCATDAQTQENRMSAWRTAMVVYLADRVSSVTARVPKKGRRHGISFIPTWRPCHAVLLTSPVQSKTAIDFVGCATGPASSSSSICDGASRGSNRRANILRRIHLISASFHTSRVGFTHKCKVPGASRWAMPLEVPVPLPKIYTIPHQQRSFLPTYRRVLRVLPRVPTPYNLHFLIPILIEL